MTLHILNDGLEMDIEDCAPELGRTHFEDDHMQCADQPSVANVLISQADFERAARSIEAMKLVRFLDDPKATPELSFHVDYDGTEYHSCTYRDPFTGRSGTEYGDTPSAALSAALRTIRYYRERDEQAEVAA